MIYTNQPVPKYVYDGSVDSLQIYSVKVVLQGRRGLEWPLHVFGLVAVRDSIDSQRNLIFNIQERDDCQTLTEEVCIYCFLNCVSSLLVFFSRCNGVFPFFVKGTYNLLIPY